MAKERDADGCALNGNVLAFSIAERSGWGIHAASFAVPAAKWGSSIHFGTEAHAAVNAVP
ncbi:hypothetical protein Q7C09_01420 [Heyndrickxia coagulans]|uniref:hypothetical protein n=1 Tax=Heyndrickxia coagulans TaxID=1398 RepID=UPI002811ABAB|nr:hypothetical protein [Heyndrickxia coagulans]WMM90104.1 hypothetical protein Q7C09_01420 [Heyndrickxia coagulans]